MVAVDDNQTFLEGLCEWIESRPELELAGTADSGEAALTAVERAKPQLVLVDAIMPVINGFEITLALKDRPDPPIVIVLSVYDNEMVRMTAQAYGADGFVSKSELLSKLPQLLTSMNIFAEDAAAQAVGGGDGDRNHGSRR